MDTFVDSLSSTETLTQSSACFSQDLSATFWQDPIHSTIQETLSALRQLNADRAAARAEIPEHPYERLKWEHCHRDAEPFNFDDIQVPEDFCHKEAHKTVSEISHKFSTAFLPHLEMASLSSFDINDHPHFGNAFAYHENGEFKVDKDKITNHFMFIDMIRSIPIDYINNNPTEFSQKILTKFIEVYQ